MTGHKMTTTGTAALSKSTTSPVFCFFFFVFFLLDTEPNCKGFDTSQRGKHDRIQNDHYKQPPHQAARWPTRFCQIYEPKCKEFIRHKGVKLTGHKMTTEATAARSSPC